MKISYTRVKMACYTGVVMMAVIGNLSPLLFLTFHELYDISYSLLGLLVVANFSTQLIVDMILSFFSYRFNTKRLLKFMPILGSVGFLIYAILPYFMPNHVYICLIVGTIIFSASSGLAEVLLSPMIATIPSDDPDREISKLHAAYAWGVVGIVIFITFFLKIFGRESWHILTLILALIPMTSAFLFQSTDLPDLENAEKMSNIISVLKNPTLWMCVFAIFLAGSIEAVMSQWGSSFLERALEIPKIIGDIFGIALFGALLGLGRSLYAKIGKHLERTLFLGVIGVTVCYLITMFFQVPLLGVVSCASVGFCISMLWPGSLVVVSNRLPKCGVFVFALMAAGGDFGAALSPQLVGLIVDSTIQSKWANEIAQSLHLTSEQLGMKFGMFVGFILSVVGIFLFYHIWKTSKKYLDKEEPNC